MTNTIINSMKKITVSNRELLRNWSDLKNLLRQGAADQLVVNEDGYTFVITYKKVGKRPGDIGDLIDKIKKMEPNKRIRKVKLEYRFKSLPDLFQE